MFLLHIPDLIVPAMTGMPLNVKFYAFWENYFKITEVALSAKHLISLI